MPEKDGTKSMGRTMGDVGALVAHGRRPNETLELGRFPSERLSDKRSLATEAGVREAVSREQHIALFDPPPTLVTMRFHPFDLLLPVLTTLNISSSAMPRTLGKGTLYRPAFSFRFSLTAELNALAWF
jgi:hypothetical protein